MEGGILSGLIDAELVHGLDVSRADPDQRFTRLNVNAVYKNKDASVRILTRVSPKTIQCIDVCGYR